jgi:alpha-tubulin suppressor-like RCC1 family protein
MSTSFSYPLNPQRHAHRRTIVVAAAALVVGSLLIGGLPARATSTGGTVWGWGFNVVGQLGDGNRTQRGAPVRVHGLTNIIQVVGDGDDGYALSATGQVYGWGLDTHGELGNGTVRAYSTVPVLVTGLTGITSIAAAGEGSAGTGYALTAAGTVMAWGYGVGGALGNGTYTSSAVPVPVSNLTGVTAVAGGGAIGGTAYAMESNGTVWAWGVGTNGGLGDGSYASSPVPVQVQGITTATAIAGGELDGYAVLQSGTVMAWGAALLSKYLPGSALGNGSNAKTDVPVTVSKVTGAVQVAAGGGEAFAVTSAGRVWAWGDGNLGDGNKSGNGVKLPVLLKITGVKAVGTDISAGIALRNNGTVWAWGSSYYGEVGNGTTSGKYYPSPVQVKGLTHVISLAASGAFVIKG